MSFAQRLRQRVTIQEPVETQDQSTGEMSKSWADISDYVDLPAEVLTGPGREFRQSGTMQAETTARINIRWFPADHIDMYRWRILWDGRIYNIRSIETDATGRREWRLRCTDGVNDG